MPTPTWITTTLTAGPLLSDSYIMAIPNLSASTKYEYRAYFIVNGTAYYGNILTGTTLPATLIPPTVSTGTAGTACPTEFPVNCNTVNTIGDASIMEYGILYTQFSAWGTDSNLIYSNYPTYAKINSTCSVIGAGVPFGNLACGLASNTMTYFRAFAKNAIGIGYGSIQCKQTSVNTVSLHCICNTSGIGDIAEAKSCFIYSTTRTAGECFYPTINWVITKGPTLDPESGSVCVLCNNICIRSITKTSKLIISCNGTFASFPVDYNDVIVLCAEANTDGESSTTASMNISSICSCVGYYNIGSPSNIIAETS
jgi:hypothetical protein